MLKESIPVTYRHTWRIPEDQSVADAALGWTALCLAASLSLEGILPKYFEGLRSLPFYLSALGAGIAFLRLPLMLGKLKQAIGLIFIFSAFLWAIVLYKFNPLRPHNESRLIMQLMLFSIIVLYVVTNIRWRNRIAWAYWVGWVLLVCFSLYEYFNGNVELLSISNKRLAVAGFSPAFHSTYVGAGLALTFQAIFSSSGFRRMLLGVSLFPGIVALLLSNTRAGTVAVMFCLAIFLITRLTRVLSGRVRLRAVVVLWLVVLSFGVYIVFTQSSIVADLLDAHIFRFQTMQKGDYSARDRLIDHGLKIFFDNPFGVGQGNSLSVFQRDFGRIIDPHNYYLRVLIEGGIFGFLLFSVGIAYIIRNSWMWLKFEPNDHFFLPMIFLFIVAASAQGFHYKITWFFLTAYALPPQIKTATNNGLSRQK